MLGNLPRGLFNFATRYLNNTLPNASNTFKWKTSGSQNCNFCHNVQTLGHVVGGCKTFLEELRYNWRHDSILQSICSFIPRNEMISVYADIPGYPSPSVITGDDKRPDIIVKNSDTTWVLELTAGYETNIQKNFERKNATYSTLLSELSVHFSNVTYVNLSMGACGVVGKDSNLLKFMKDLRLRPEDTAYHISKIMNICIRSTFYIFCRRNKDWDNPALMSW